MTEEEVAEVEEEEEVEDWEEVGDLRRIIFNNPVGESDDDDDTDCDTWELNNASEM